MTTQDQTSKRPFLRAAKTTGLLTAALACAVLATGALTLNAAPAEAGPKHRQSNVHHHHHYIDHGRPARGRHAGGPPPWAPAHGYRARQGRTHHHHHYHSDPGPRHGRGYGQPLPVMDLDLGRCYRESVGQVLGGASGAVLGSTIGSGNGQLVAIASGAILGTILGGDIGRSLDRIDYACMGHALEYAPSGQPVTWSNPDLGGDYYITPTSTYQSTSGRYCREYSATARIGGRTEETYGTACRQPDGSWEIVN